MEFDSLVLAASVSDLSGADAASPVADCLEYRMDLDTAPLEALASYGGDLPIIATNRAAWEGGESPEEGRLEALEAAIDHPAVEAVDVELASIDRGDADGLLASAADRGVAVIASSHDFGGTPAVEAMRERLADAAAVADVAKLAVTATSRSDALDLLSVTHEADRDGLSVATMAMGAVGSHTRVLAPLYGSLIGYAPPDPAAATAPGQYDLETLASLLGALGVESGRVNTAGR